MTHTAVAANVHSFKPEPFPPADVAYRGQPAVLRQIAEHERHCLARELHDGAIQEVLAAGLAIDLCLADVPPGSPLHVRSGTGQAADRNGHAPTAVVAAEPARGR